MRTISLTTGDITTSNLSERQFTVAVEGNTFTLGVDGKNVSLPLEEWDDLLRQVRTRSLAKWKFSRMPHPMGGAEMQIVVARVNTTPAYQLFLAGFDVAEAVSLTSEFPDEVVYQKCESLRGRIPSAIGPRGLYFVPNDLIEKEELALKTLVRNNKLCQLRADIDDFETVEKVYIPYATPVDLKDSDKRAMALWEKLRTYVYAFH